MQFNVRDIKFFFPTALQYSERILLEDWQLHTDRLE